MKKLILSLSLLFCLLSQAQVSIIHNNFLEISNIYPKDNEIIEQSELTGMLIWGFVRDVEEVFSVEFIVNGISMIALNTSEGPVFTAPLTPSSYGPHTFKIIATSKSGTITVSETSFTIKHTPLIFCEGITEWSNTTYPNAGTKISYNGILYINKWYASPIEIPRISDVWKQIGTCNEYSSEEYCNSLPWSSSVIYDHGDMVYHEHRIYQARWWTQNNIPGSNNSWQYVSYCDNPSEKYSISKSLNQTNPKETSHTKIEIYDLSGMLIRALHNEKNSSISTTIQQVLSDLDNGIYIYKITIGEKVYTKKITKNTN